MKTRSTPGVVLQPFEKFKSEIKRRLGRANAVCVVCKTGRGLWSLYRTELLQALREPSGTLRWIVVDPENGAVKMLASASEMGCSAAKADGAIVANSSAGPSSTGSARVFLCYARPDQARVERFFKELQSLGFAPWMDTKKIEPGSNWPQAIREAIDQSDLFLALLSKHCKPRERGPHWKVEIDHALRLLAQRPNFVVPVRLEDCSAPRRLERLQWVDWFVEDRIEKLRTELGLVLQSRRLSVSKQAIVEARRLDIRAALNTMKAVRNGLARPESLHVATMDYLPPWTLILVDSDTSDGVAFVEISAFNDDPTGRPTLVLRAGPQQQWLDFFREQFETMWRNARHVLD